MRNKIRSDIIDLTGKRFGKLTVLRKAEKTTTGSKWECVCDCGNIKTYWSVNLRNGPNKSCGCLRYIKCEKYQNDLEQRLLNSSEIEGDCRIWKAFYKDKFGYGKIIVRGKAVMAHRVAWSIWVGEIPKGMCVLHICDNPKCINPKHLFLGNRHDNINDMMSKKRNKQPKGELNGWSKLTESQVLEIRKDCEKENFNISHIAKKYNVSRFCINSIRHRKSWKHL